MTGGTPKIGLCYTARVCSLIGVDDCIWDRSSVWLERLPVTQEVAGSSPVGPGFFKQDSRPRACRPVKSKKYFYLASSLVDVSDWKAKEVILVRDNAIILRFERVTKH